MSEFSVLKLYDVCDLLAAYTTTYTKMLTLNLAPSIEFFYIKEIIERLQQEIHARTLNSEIKPDEYSKVPAPPIGRLH